MNSVALVALSQSVLSREKEVFDRPICADWEIEAVREKAAKQVDQKASYASISLLVGRATRASWQRVTRTVWTEKEPLSKACQRPHQKLGNPDNWSKRIPGEKKRFNGMPNGS